MTTKLPTDEGKPPQFDDVLRRMLSSPPAPHVKKKSAPKAPQPKDRNTR